MTRLIRGRAGPLTEIVAEARAVGRRSVMLAELAFLHTQLTQLQAANRAHDTADKAYAVEQRFNALINKLQNLGIDANGVLQYNDVAGNKVSVGQQISFLTANASQCNSTTQASTGMSVPVASGISYWVEMDAFVICQSANDMYLTLAGPSTSAFTWTIKWEQLNVATSGHAEHWSVTQTVMGNNTGVHSKAAASISGEDYWCHAQGWLTPSSNANLVVNQASSANLASFTVSAGSVLRVLSVS